MQIYRIFYPAMIAVCLAWAVWADGNPFLRNINAHGSDHAVIIVLDASGSMGEKSSQGYSKMQVAKQNLEKVMSQIDGDVMLGLRVYGATKMSMDTSIACSDTQLLVAPASNNRANIINSLRGVKPNGATPIGMAIMHTVQDLSNVPAKHKSIILISDGVDTCGYDPCAIANEMKRKNVDINIDVIGYGRGLDMLSAGQLKCVASATKGKYYNADSDDALIDGLTQSIQPFSRTVRATISAPKE